MAGIDDRPWSFLYGKQKLSYLATSNPLISKLVSLLLPLLLRT
jgi:hypothetical protein